MIYELSDTLSEISFDCLNSTTPTVCFLSKSEFEQYYTYLGFDISEFLKINHNVQNFRTKIDIGTDCISGNIRIIEPDINSNNEANLQFVIKTHLVVLINISDSARILSDNFFEALNRFPCTEHSTDKFVYAFIDSLIQSDNKSLEDIEIQINKIENSIISNNGYKNFNEENLLYKRKLLQLRNYYEQLIDIGEALCENENGIFGKDSRSYFRRFVLRTERLRNEVNILRENLVQLRELYQSTLDLRLNNTMKLFTVITAVFSPLTLITGWYGMNFVYMPELKWKYGYVYVFLLALSVVITAVYIFKKKRLI
jgi:magnesium transporter